MGDFNATPLNSSCYVFRGQGDDYSVKDAVDPYQRMANNDPEKMGRLDKYYKDV